MNEEHDNQHRQVWDLIPWVVAGSASAAERLLVQQHVSGCTDCLAELTFHRDLLQGMQANDLAQNPVAEAEAAWQQMQSRIERSDAQKTTDTTRQTAASPLHRPRRGAATQRWLVAAVLVQAVGLAALATLLQQRQPLANYQTLSTPVTTHAALRLVPAAGLPMGELAALLSTHGLQIVESSVDGSVLGLALGPAAQGDAAALAARLRGRPGVLLVEPVRQP
jgi:Putative zinc-finger